MKKVVAFYLEADKKHVPLWREYFCKHGIVLEHHTQWNGIVSNGNYDFYLVLSDLFFVNGKIPDMGKNNKPVFIISDYVDQRLLKNSLTLGVKDCFDPSTPLSEIVAEIKVVLKDCGLGVKNLEKNRNQSLYWPLWKEVKIAENITRLSDLSLLQSPQLMEQVFIHEFFRAQGNLSELANSVGGVTRVTVKKYFNQFQRKIFSLLIEYFSDQGKIPGLSVKREAILQTLKKKWFFDSFLLFTDIYAKDAVIMSKVLKEPQKKIVDFEQYWTDLMRER